MSWKATTGSDVQYYENVFTVDESISVVDGVTLADVERELAYRVGPYYRETASGGSTSSIVIPAFQSTLTYMSNVADMFILRRGLFADGSAVTGFDVTDRVRAVDSLDPGTGAIIPDRNWTVAPVDDEEVEFHHLHPTSELRKAALEGLKRCYIFDRTSATFTEAASERDITEIASWITNRKQIKRVETSFANTPFLPFAVWWDVFTKNGHVWLRAARDPYPNAMLVTALRPASTFVNDRSLGARAGR